MSTSSSSGSSSSSTPTQSSSSSSSSSSTPSPPRSASHPHHPHHPHHPNDHSSGHDHPPLHSSSSSAPHPLLPPLPGNVQPGSAPPLYAAELDRYALHRAIYEETHKPTAIPEKCFTFCNQRADNQPICRMFCLRKRSILNTQAEDLARLRPPPRRAAATSATVESSKAPESSQGLSSWEWNWSPFEALKRRLAPYSIIYVKGTPDGVVGRYMEEMEADDGQHDFGTVSRGAGDLIKRRREDDTWEWLDWGDHGSLLYLPLTTIFHPIINIPDSFRQVFSPGFSLFRSYASSFTDGTQAEAYAQVRNAIKEGEAQKTLKMLGAEYVKTFKEHEAQRKKRRAEIEQQNEELKRHIREQEHKRQEGRMDKMRDMGKDLDGKEVD